MKETNYKSKERKLNILQVHNFYREPGGEDVVVKNEAEMLKEHGHRVYKYYRRNEEIAHLPLFEKIILPFDSVFSVKTYIQIRRIIRKKKIDLVHVHNTLHLISPSVFWAARKEGIPVVMTVHNYRLCCPKGTFYQCQHICEKCMTNGLVQAVRYRCYRNSFWQSVLLAVQTYVHRKLHTYRDVHFICLTDFQKEKICRLTDVSSEHVFLKPNVLKKNELKNQKLEKITRKNQILFVGRLEEEKGILDLLEAYRMMSSKLQKEEYQVPKLVICGEGKLDFACQLFIKENHIKNVAFMGQVSHEKVLKTMSESKCVVIPSRWYEVPLVLIEAYWTKTPAIVPELGGFSSFVRNGVNGFKYAPYHTDELAALLSMMTARPWEMTCDFSRMDILEQTEYETNYRRLRRIYERCIKDVRTSEKESAIRK
ncbi:MAG: glycosyltransferase family 4 protein [Lachnospiraceae bacterium]|nr:glycosyltransferase family 4 protein [Lachnospiraceae bacterium]